MVTRQLMIVFLVSILALSACNGASNSTAPASTATSTIQLFASATPTASPASASASTPTTESTQAVESTASTAPQVSATSAVASTTSIAQGTASSPTPTPFPNAADCTNIVAFYGDITIPDGTQMQQGQKFTKTWRVRNNGTCTWGAGYNLVFAWGELLGGPMEQALPLTAPGDIIEVSVDLTAPPAGGDFTGYWQFQDPQGNVYATGITGNVPLWVYVTVPYYSTAVSPAQSTTGLSTATSGSSSSGELQAGCSATRDTSVEAQVLNLINQARTSNGLEALTLNSELTTAALAHSTDMACQDFVSHTGSNGSTWLTRASAQGYSNPSSVRENIYVGNPAFGGTADGAFTWWMNSQVHRDNILFATVTEIGIAYVFNPNSAYGGYYTTVFGKP